MPLRILTFRQHWLQYYINVLYAVVNSESPFSNIVLVNLIRKQHKLSLLMCLVYVHFS